MSSTFSSPTDEFGSGEIIIGFRRILDIADDKGDYYLLKSGPFSRIQKVQNIFMDKPLIIPAGRTFTHMSEGGNWLYTNFTDPAPPMFSTFPLKEGIITGFSDNGASGTTVASTTHGGNDGDTFTIIGSRVKEYDINAEIFNVLTDSFDIPVLFNGADGQCRFTQSKLRISAMSDGGDGTVDLTMVNHGLDADISINITNASNGLTSATYVINEIVDDDTITITATFPGSTGTADGDMSYGIIDYTNETFFNFTGNATPPQCFNMQGNGGSILVFNSSNIADFDVGEVRDHFSVNWRGGSAIRNCSGLTVIGGGLVTFNDAAVGNTTASFNTNSYKACFVASEGSTAKIGTNIVNLTLQANQSFYNFSEFVDDNFRGTITSALITGTGNYFSTGYFARSSAAISDGGSSTIIIPVDDTLKFREGDTIVLSESTSYNGLSGAIQSSGIIQNTSIQVDIAFSTADTDVLIQDTIIASLDGTSPPVQVTTNQDLVDSATTSQFTLNESTPIEVIIDTIDVPVPIDGGVWSANTLQRVTADVGNNGIATITALDIDDYLVAFWAVLDKQGGIGNVDIALTILVNGVDVTLNAPRSLIGTVNQVVGNQLLTLSEGDTVQLAVVNHEDTTNIDVHQANMAILRGA